SEGPIGGDVESSYSLVNRGDSSSARGPLDLVSPERGHEQDASAREGGLLRRRGSGSSPAQHRGAPRRRLCGAGTLRPHRARRAGRGDRQVRGDVRPQAGQGAVIPPAVPRLPRAGCGRPEGRGRHEADCAHQAARADVLRLRLSTRSAPAPLLRGEAGSRRVAGPVVQRRLAREPGRGRVMLRSLVALAEREGLVEDPAFEERRVDFEIRLDAEGRYEALISLRDEKGRGKRMSVPRSPPKRTVAVAAGLLVDNAKYVLGIGTPGKDRPERLEQCQEAFLARLADALRASKDPALQAAHRFCSNGSDYRAAILGDRPASEWTGSELLVISVAGYGYVHERPEVRKACSQLGSAASPSSRAKSKRVTSTEVRCLVTGRVSAPARLHHPIKRVPGGRTSGTSLVSFNA